jgi:pilus assembly protein CpaE
VDFHSDALELLLTELRRSFDVVVLDIPRAVAVQQQAALADATIAVVSDMSLLGVRDTLRLSGFAKRAYSDGNLLTIINRVGGDKKGEVPKGDFEKGIEGKIDILVPEDKKTLAVASQSGKPIATVAKRNKVANAMRDIAKEALPPDEEKNKDKDKNKEKSEKKDKKERQPLWRRKKEK